MDVSRKKPFLEFSVLCYAMRERDTQIQCWGKKLDKKQDICTDTESIPAWVSRWRSHSLLPKVELFHAFLGFALLHPETIRRDNNIDNAINTSMHIDNLCLRLLCFSGQFCWRESTADVNTLCSQPTGRGHGRLIQNIWKQPTCEYSLFKRHTPCLMWIQAIKLGHTNTEIERMNCFFLNILSELKEDKAHMMFSVDILSSWKHWFLNCICFYMCCLFTWWRTEYNSNVVFLAHEF